MQNFGYQLLSLIGDFGDIENVSLTIDSLTKLKYDVVNDVHKIVSYLNDLLILWFSRHGGITSPAFSIYYEKFYSL